MTLLWKVFINDIALRKPAYYTSITQKYLFHTCLPPRIRVSRKSCFYNALRYQNTSAIQSNLSQTTKQLGQKTKTASELKKLFLLARPEKWRLIGAIAFLFISSSVTMAVPFCLGKVIDIIYTVDKEHMKQNLNKLTYILLGVFIIGGLSNCCRVYLMSTAGHRITQALRKKAYSAILCQETAMFDKQSTGELVGRLTGDTQLISSAITSNVSDGLRSAIMTVAGVSMMLYVSPQLATVGLSVVPVLAGLAVVYSRFLKKVSKDVQSSIAVLNTTAEEKIGNIRTVKAFAQELNEIKKYDLKLQDLLNLSYKESFYRGVFFGLTGLTGNAIVLLVLYYGSVMISDATITIGNLSAFLLYAAYTGISVNGLSTFYTELYKALGANERVFQLIDRQPGIPIQGGKVLKQSLSGDIIFKNVNFSYPTREDSLILKDFNLSIPRNSVTAIVGVSGSGKSTIASLLLRLYDPVKGSILLDNHDLRELDPNWVKSQIGVVFQEPILFSGTIRENILYGAENVQDCDLEEVARQAYVMEFAEKMKHGLETVVGERGITLSGGQRQRVAIARALIKKPKILILDEATSALDAKSEKFVQDAFEKASHDRTVLTIAHRLSTIKSADKIVALDQGQVVESGTYNELMGLESGYFKKLVAHQSFM